MILSDTLYRLRPGFIDSHGYSGQFRLAWYRDVMGPMHGDAGPLEYGPLDDFDHPLLAARDIFDRWDIFYVGSTYLAVPADTEVFTASTVDALAVKLHRAQGPDESA